MAETLRQLGLDRTRARKGAVRPELTPSQIRGLLADVATGGGVPFIDAASQAAQGNYGQAAVSGLLDAPPVKMAGMALAPLIGMVRKAAPMDEALRIAQKNAAKPVSKGGLGLPKNNTPMDRARAMGFDTDVVHFSRHGIDEPELDSGKYAVAPFDAIGTHVGSKDAALERFRNTVGTTEQIKGSTYPVLIKRGNEFLMEGRPWEEDRLNSILRKMGGHDWSDINGGRMTYQQMNADLRKKLLEEFDSIPYVNDVEAKGQISYIVPPHNIRSRFAAFDPARINENNLLASLAALGISVPVMRGLLQEEEMQ